MQDVLAVRINLDMDEHAVRVLEYEKVIARLARLCAFSGGRDLALALRPSSNYETVVERQATLTEAMRLRGSGIIINLAGASDVRGPIEKAALNGVLDAQELLNVASTQRAAQQARGALSRVASLMPRLGRIGATIAERGDIVNEIGRALDANGQVLDGASPALGIIRHDVRIAHDRLQSRLQAFLGSDAKNALQEPLVTLRDGRYVVPIKAEFRGEVRGIVHDVSASGATVFIEPLVAVDLANHWRELQIEEHREIERIFRRLSGLVGEEASALSNNVGLLATLDLILSSARLGEELSTGGAPVLPGADTDVDPSSWLLRGDERLELVEARHPMLTSPVPISLGLGGEDRVILVTGPNTGGKTVALKTVGLLCLMAQAGLPVPAAPGSRLPVYEDVLADIGDEQSIEQSLSTFSGHLTNVISLLKRAGPATLVLLDELAAGTDPTEGAALARSLLQHLMTSGAVVLATTHHGELKLFAHNTPGVRNASVEFDPVTLTPTYRILVGIPGRSNALAIAARLGLPEEILQVARDSIAPEDVAIDSLLADLHEERAAASAERQAEAQARRRAEQARASVEARLAGLDDERAQRLDEAALALEQEVEAARDALARAQRLAARQTPVFTTQEVQEARSDIAEASEAAKRLRRRSRRRRRVGAPKIEEIRPGVSVWVQGLPMPAEVISAPDRHGDIDVSLGGLRARVAVSQVTRIDKQTMRAIERNILPPPPQSVLDEIQVRGQTLDEALPQIEKFIDEGFRAGMPRLRVVHGKGTGKMRNAVRAMLSKHPLVKSYDFAAPAEGGEGVTVVEVAR